MRSAESSRGRLGDISDRSTLMTVILVRSSGSGRTNDKSDTDGSDDLQSSGTSSQLYAKACMADRELLLP